jgi:Putative beta-barrel porin-2, OmpL-like. bbp2
MRRLNLLVSFFLFVVMLSGLAASAQSPGTVTANDDEDLRRTVRELALRVSALEEELHKERAASAAATSSPAPTAAASPVADVRSSVEGISSSEAAGQPILITTVSTIKAARAPAVVAQPAGASNTPVLSALPTRLPGGATLNYAFDGYYDYDFNHPIGRVQYLRAYDVLSNAFSINQADVVFALDPDVEAGRRYGMRLDLQFGQATEALQGNPADESRPEIYRNIFQVYGTYVVPLGKGLTVDVESGPLLWE